MEQEKLTNPEKAAELAANYFREGLNCAECVLLACLETQGSALPKEVIGMASGFGGGVGRTKHLCGAVSGAVMALGAVKGRADPFALPEVKQRAQQLSKEVYPLFASLINDVEREFGSSTCAELTKPFPDFDGKERKHSCQAMIRYCAALATRIAEAPSATAE